MYQQEKQNGDVVIGGSLHGLSFRCVWRLLDDGSYELKDATVQPIPDEPEVLTKPLFAVPAGHDTEAERQRRGCCDPPEPN